MNFDEYQKSANGFMSEEAKQNPLLNAVLGMSGESGECADQLKKVLFQGHKFDKERFVLELGDVLWYLAEACCALDIPLSTIAEKNIEKLRSRFHGNTFDAEKSRCRND